MSRRALPYRLAALTLLASLAMMSFGPLAGHLCARQADAGSATGHHATGHHAAEHHVAAQHAAAANEDAHGAMPAEHCAPTLPDAGAPPPGPECADAVCCTLSATAPAEGVMSAALTASVTVEAPLAAVHPATVVYAQEHRARPAPEHALPPPALRPHLVLSVLLI